MRILYDIFFLVFSILYLPYLLLKGKLHKDFFQRFGALPNEVKNLDRPIWIHAVSVGEAALASGLAVAIKKRFNGIPVIVSTTTKTGNEMAKKTGRGVVDGVFYCPLDFSFIVRKVIKIVRPRLYCMVETELWPNLLGALSSENIPVALINGRISDSSFKNYRIIKGVLSKMLSSIDLYCMQSKKDAERIEALGANAGSVHVTGSMKFDMVSDILNKKEYSKKDFGFTREDEVIIAGSTHSPEECIILDVFKKLKDKHNNLKLILASRHIERVGEVKKYVDERGFSFYLFSELGDRSNPQEERDILIVDTIGDLKNIYSVGSIIFIGGSLVKKGGQNPIEGARWLKPTVFGPYMHNFRDISNMFVEKGASIKVQDGAELKDVLEKLLVDPGKRQKMAENASVVINDNTGATERTVERLAKLVEPEARNSKHEIRSKH